MSWEQPSVHDLVDKDASPDLQLGWHGSPHHLPGPHSVWTHLILVPYLVCQWLLAHSLHSHPILSASACNPSLGQQLPTGGLTQRDPLSPSLSLLSISLSISSSLSLLVEAGFVSSLICLFSCRNYCAFTFYISLSPERTILDYGDDSMLLIKEDRFDSFHMSRSLCDWPPSSSPGPCFLSP